MPSETTSPREADADRPTVLLAESDVLIRAPLAAYLRDCGYRVLEAQSAAEAKALLNAGQTRVDLVFIDAGLAGAENGFALATWLRQTWPGLDVLLTAGVANAAQKAAEVCESGPMLAKPYSHEHVLARIQKLLHQAGRRGP